MIDGGLEPTGRLLAGLAVLGLLGAATVIYRRRNRGSRPELTAALDTALADALPAGRGTHLEQPPQGRGIDVLEGEEGDETMETRLAPAVRIDLETADTPGMELVFDYVADVLEAIHPVLEDHDEPVVRYDLEFSFGPDGLLVDGERRRVTVPATFAERLLEEETYRAFDLRKDVERVDEREDEVGTLWAAC
ncbi:hypothetical protein [Natronobacterium gregoryi]|uniref:Uncharacterized protein n=2 Tax=Natronobacterium gregoryi TaxID=44930 RepID=L0AKL3_NATGS|nr:hypothetical protein [Natronobacterium gregoryi]AFZ74341.1 hypothetical protein Natgr_3211 [Natronobacterium gregoryi SP2]ELY63437.1 hypothetical protein C490_16194 [Natronobacterium gregoryi SP2]PLK22149.1 hypothetical protein CYV19_00280 [Natronobacterium gregoryi SP2]SFI54085.1 hypothetical protein SAMN05443661_101231 [Natronobacterium gregoryi]